MQRARERERNINTCVEKADMFLSLMFLSLLFLSLLFLSLDVSFSLSALKRQTDRQKLGGVYVNLSYLN